MPDEGKRALDIYLAEYNSLRAEQLSRVQTQNYAFNFLVLIIAAAFTAIITSANSGSGDSLPAVVLAVALALPLVTCPLGYIFFDNEIMIHAVGSYLYYDRRPHMMRIVGDSNILGSPMAFERLPRSTHLVFPRISQGRWILFCIPTFLPVLVLPFYTHQQWLYLTKYLPTADQYFVIAIASMVLVYAVDIAACWRLSAAIRWIYENAGHQDRLHQEEMAARRAEERITPTSTGQPASPSAR
jgi:hypothetical protein